MLNNRSIRRLLAIVLAATTAFTSMPVYADELPDIKSYTGAQSDAAETEYAEETGADAGQEYAAEKEDEDTVSYEAAEFDEVTSLRLNKSDLSLGIGKKATLTATLIYTGTAPDISWYSDDMSVVTVTQRGDKEAEVTGVGLGTANVGILVDGKTATCSVTVTENVVDVTRVTLNTTELVLSLGSHEYDTLIATVEPENASNKEVTWTSSDESVATVDSSGHVNVATPNKVGKTTITASAGGKTATCVVVVQRSVTGVTLNQTEKKLYLDGGVNDDKVTLTATVAPSDATNKQVNWLSSDTSVATVTAQGEGNKEAKVEAKAPGKAVITVTTEDGKYTKECLIDVIQLVTAVELNKTDLALFLNGHDSETLSVVLNAGGTQPTGVTVSWSVSDPGDPTQSSDVVVVDDNGKVTAKKTGRAVITATVTDKDKPAAVDPIKVTCTVTVGQAVTGVTIQKGGANLTKHTMDIGGGSLDLTAVLTPASPVPTNTKVSWISSNTDVVEVKEKAGGDSREAEVTAIAPGKAVVTVITADGGKTASCAITVRKAVESISLNVTSQTLSVGESFALLETVYPMEANNKEVEWSTSDANVATVDDMGRVKVKAEGDPVTITATSKDNDSVKATCLITVINPVISVTGVTIDETDLSEGGLFLYKGETKALHAIIEPSDATNKNVTWTSSDTATAEVDADDGVVTAKEAGTATITVKTEDGEKTASVTVTVEEATEVPVTKVTIENAAKQLKVGESVRLSAVFEPDNATNRSVVWSFSPSGIVTVSKAGVVTGVAPGNVSITVTTTNGKKDTCTMMVTRPVTDISLDKSVLALEVKETAELTATVEPSDASDKNIIWTSSNDSVAKVESTTSNRGKVTALSPGTVTVTATTREGEVKATCRVTVTQPVTRIVLSRSDLVLHIGKDGNNTKEYITLAATVEPSTASDQRITWFSTAPDVVKVDSSGKVTAEAEGSAVIGAMTVDGRQIATCSVTVVAIDEDIPVERIVLHMPSDPLKVGESTVIPYTVYPENATNKSVEFSAGDTTIVAIDEAGRVTALNPGRTSITVTAVDKSGGKPVLINGTIDVVQPVAGVSLNITSHDMFPGDTVKLTASVFPENASNQAIIWKTSNSAIATVRDGVVTAISVGQANIIVETVDGSLTAVCAINVKKTVRVTGVTIQPESLTLNVGGDAYVSVKLVGEIGADGREQEPTNKEIHYFTLDETVVTINPFGRVVAKGTGKTRIRVMSDDGEKEAFCDVTVVQNAKRLVLDQSDLILTLGDSETLRASIYPENSTEKDLVWYTSNESVATVKDGTVEAVGEGTAGITVTTKDGKLTASCTVRVLRPGVTVLVQDVSLNEAELSLEIGDSVTLSAAIKPSDASNKNVMWRSSDSSVATVDRNGKVTAVKEGEAEITVTTVDGWKTATCYVVVKGQEETPDEIVPVVGVRLNKAFLELEVGETENLIAYPLPENATNKEVSWISSDPLVASVGRYGKVTGRSRGTATVKVVTDDGSFTAECSVTVTDEKLSIYDNLPVTGVTLDKENLLLVVGRSKTLIAEIEPAQAANKKVLWTSSNSEIASVNKFGYVTGMARGTATITVTTEDGGMTASCIVKVIEERELSLDPEDNSWGDILPEDRPDELDEIPYGLWIAGIDRKGYLYTGAPITPEVRVYNRNRRLIEGRDYRLIYQYNVNANDGSLEYKNAGMPAVIVRGMGNYTGEERVSFRILPVDISSANPLVVAGKVCVPFNKKYQKPLPDIWYDGKKLNHGTDFSCVYQDTSGNTVECGNSGTYRIFVKGVHNYTGTRIVDLLVADYGQKVLSDAVISKITDRPYIGSAIEPKDFKVTYDGKLLSEDMYDVRYLNNVMIGKAYVIISANAKSMGLGYVGQKTAEFNIIGRNIKDASVSGISEKNYNGGKLTQDLRVFYGVDNELLYEGVDYKVDYTNNVNVGKASMVITGIGAYSGTIKKTFKIKPYRITDPAVDVINVGDFRYTKGGCKPEPKVVFTDKDGNQVKLVQDIDYTITYKHNKALNTDISSKKCAYVIIKGKGNFTGKRKVYFTIDQQDLSALDLVVPNKPYSSKKRGWRSPVKIYDLNGKALEAGKDYKRVEYTCGGVPIDAKEKLPVGTEITVTVTATGRKYTGVRTGTYQIVGSDLSEAKVAVRNPDTNNSNRFEYTGKPVELTKDNLTVYVRGNILTADQYDIVESTYRNNVKKGTASVRITGKGDYGGSVTVRYRITKKGISWWWRN